MLLNVINMLTDKLIPIQAWISPHGSRRSRLTEFIENRDMKVAKFSALRPGRIYSPWDTLGALFSSKLSRTWDKIRAEWLRKWKIPMTSNGNWILGFWACVAQCLNFMCHGVPHNNHVSGKIRCVLLCYVSFRLWAQVLFRKYYKNPVAKLEDHSVQYNGLQLNKNTCYRIFT